MPSNTIRVGIVGCGGIAFAKHLPFLSQMDGVEMRGFTTQLRKGKKSQGAVWFKGCKNLPKLAGPAGRPQH